MTIRSAKNQIDLTTLNDGTFVLEDPLDAHSLLGDFAWEEIDHFESEPLSTAKIEEAIDYDAAPATGFEETLLQESGVEPLVAQQGLQMPDDQISDVDVQAVSLDDAFMGGTDGNDVLSGLNTPQGMSGYEGDDLIYGNGGNDVIYAHQGADTIYGNEGVDIIFGGQDEDTIYGGRDEDRLFGNLGGDRIYGNLGDDLIFAGGGNDVVFGGQDNDAIHGGEGIDQIFGNKGNDMITGGPGADILTGGEGTDVFVVDALDVITDLEPEDIVLPAEDWGWIFWL